MTSGASSGFSSHEQVHRHFADQRADVGGTRAEQKLAYAQIAARERLALHEVAAVKVKRPRLGWLIAGLTLLLGVLTAVLAVS